MKLTTKTYTVRKQSNGQRPEEDGEAVMIRERSGSGKNVAQLKWYPSKVLSAIAHTANLVK